MISVSEFPQKIVALVVAVIVVFAVGIPFIQNSISESQEIEVESTSNNTGATYTYSEIGAYYLIEKLTDSSFVYRTSEGGTAYTIPTVTSGILPLIATDTFIAYVDSNGVHAYGTFSDGVYSPEISGDIIGNVMELSNGTATISHQISSVTATYTEGIGFDNDGTAGSYGFWTSADMSIYADAVSELYYFGVGGSKLAYAYGTYDAMSDKFGDNNGSYTTSFTVTVTHADSNYPADTITAITDSLTEDDATASRGLIAPIQYDSSHTVYQSVVGLLNVLPILMGIGVLLACIGLFITRKA